METLLQAMDKACEKTDILRKTTCVLRQFSEKGLWVVDNSYRTTLLDGVVGS